MSGDPDFPDPAPDDTDDGNPYGGSDGDYDRGGAARVAHPGDIPAGPSRKFIPRDVVERIGTQGRAPLHVERPVEPTRLPFNPFRFSGVQPTRLPTDPRGTIGTSVASTPAHVVLSRLKSKGAEPWMLHWVYDRGTRGVPTDIDILRQCDLLARFGDTIAPRLLSYAQSINARIEMIQRSQRQQSQQRAQGMGVIRRTS